MRDLMILVGLGLVARRALGSGASTIVPMAYVMIAMLFGNRESRSWDLVLADTATPSHLIIAGALLAVGVILGCSEQADRRVHRGRPS